MGERCGNDQIASFDNMKFYLVESRRERFADPFPNHVAKRGCLFMKPSLFLLLNFYKITICDREGEDIISMAAYGGKYVADKEFNNYTYQR